MKMNNKQAIYTDKVVQASVRLRVKSPGNGSTDRQLALKYNSMENSNINLMRTGFFHWQLLKKQVYRRQLL